MDFLQRIVFASPEFYIIVFTFFIYSAEGWCFSPPPGSSSQDAKALCSVLDKILSFHILWVKDNNFRLYLYLALSSLVLQTTKCSLCAPDHHIAFSLLHPLLWILFLVISIFMSIPSLSFEAYSKAINIELEVQTNYCKEAGIWILKAPFNTQSSQHCDCIFFFIYYSYIRRARKSGFPTGILIRLH